MRRRSSSPITIDKSKLLGKGAFGKVYVGVFRNGETKPSAVKVIPRSKFDEDEIQVHAELSMYPDCNKHVACLYKVEHEGDDVLVAMELIEGKELFELVGKDAFTYAQLRDMMKQLLEGLAYIHSKDVAHLDIKMENIMVDLGHGGRDYKFIDFGFACSEEESTCLGSDLTPHATTYLTAPEYYNQLLPTGTSQSLDVWALGATFLEVILNNEGLKARIDNVFLDGARVSKKGDDWVATDTLKSLEFKPQDERVWKLLDVISKMMLVNPQKRATAPEALELIEKVT